MINKKKTIFIKPKIKNSDSKKKSYIYSFAYETRKSINDKHLWLSVIKRPSYSVFTRVDRLTCSFAIIYMSMLLNILYFDISSKASILDGIKPQIVSKKITLKLKIIYSIHFKKDFSGNNNEFNHISTRILIGYNV